MTDGTQTNVTVARTLDDLLRLLHEHRGEIEERFAVSSMSVFGSYVRGEQRAGSDLDLLVEFRRTPTFIELAELEDYLRDLLGVRVDVGTRGGLKGRIGTRILAEAIAV